MSGSMPPGASTPPALPMPGLVPAAAPVPPASWLPFAGTAERRGALIRLTAEGGNGFIELDGDDVGSTPEGRFFVRQGAIARHVDEPPRGDATARPPPDAVAGECPSGITCCVGSVLICCADFKVIGIGRGAWGCQRDGFVP